VFEPVRGEYFAVGCGKCRYCKIKKRREWTTRILHEITNSSGLFVTLTYSEESLLNRLETEFIDLHTLYKPDVQKFLKRLRKKLHPRKIKYFLAGEYGDTTHRPHYHAIILHVTYKDEKIIKESWGLGNVHIGIAEKDSIQYTVGYIDKKYYSQRAIDEYDSKGLQRPFQLQSQGIGSNYALTHQDEILQKEGVQWGKNIISIPRYYLKKYGMEYRNLKGKHKAKQNEKERKENHDIIGVKKTLKELKKSVDITSFELYIKLRQKQRDGAQQTERNLDAKFKIRRSKI